MSGERKAQSSNFNINMFYYVIESTKEKYICSVSSRIAPILSTRTTFQWASPAPGTCCVCSRIRIVHHTTTPTAQSGFTRQHQAAFSVSAGDGCDIVTHIAVFQISLLLKGYSSRRSQRPPWRCSGNLSHSPSMGGRSASFQR
jgi:hypothetical protein